MALRPTLMAWLKSQNGLVAQSPRPAREWRCSLDRRLGWQGAVRSGGRAPVGMGRCVRQDVSDGVSLTRPNVDGVASRRQRCDVPSLWQCSDGHRYLGQLL
jgi:hypothetical protein